MELQRIINIGICTDPMKTYYEKNKNYNVARIYINCQQL